jgi:hypothetical protein
LLFVFVCGWVVGCATTPVPQAGKVIPQLAEMGVDSRTLVKISRHRVLGYDDILNLVQKRVAGPVIVSYLQSTKAPYAFSSAQIERLIDAGASPDLVNYLGKSTGFFEASERDQTGGAGKWKANPYFADPYYLGAPPFPYAFPMEWGDPAWVDEAF